MKPFQKIRIGFGLFAVLTLQPSFGQPALPRPAAINRLGPLVDFISRHGTNRPISEATAKAFDLGNEPIPAIQAGVLPPGESLVHVFSVSTRNTNDLFAALIDRNTRNGTVWLTSRSGEIRKTILVSTNNPPQPVSNESGAESFVEQVELFTALAQRELEISLSPTNGQETLGEDAQDASGTVREISERFGHAELQELHEMLNSPEFQSRLTNYNCGDPVPKLRFSVSIRPKGYAQTRAVEIYHSPGLSAAGRTRCLSFGLNYLLDKAVAALDPDPQQEETREPHCDCSKRDDKEEWVSHPGPDEILAKAKVAAKMAAREADEAQQEKERNLSVIHLDAADVRVAPDPEHESLVTREKSLGKLPAREEMSLLIVSPDLNHWACAVKRGGKQFVIRDGMEEKSYDEIPDHQRLVFSADGNHFAYIAKQNGRMFVVVDGKEGKAYQSIEELFHPIFSPDDKRLAYIASAPALAFPPEKTFAVVDGREQKGYDLVEAILFSPGSKHVAYNAEKQWNRGMVVVLDEKEGKTYGQIAEKCFSPDGNHLAYVADIGVGRNLEGSVRDFVVLDGKEGKAYKSISGLRFSPDSKHIAYVAGEGSSGMQVLVRDGAETRYAHMDLGPFSPNSQHLACVARFETNWLVLIDGKRLDPQSQLAVQERSFGPVSDLLFSPDSRHLAYIERVSETNWAIVLDGKIVRSCSGIAVSPAFSPDSQRLAYAIRHGVKCAPLFGGQEGKEYEQILTWRSSVEDGARTVGIQFSGTNHVHLLAIQAEEVLRVELELVRK